MLPVSYCVVGERTSPKFAHAFASGCRGIHTTDLTHLQPGPFAAFCTPPTWPLLARAQAEGREWYYGDHGLFRGRRVRAGEYYRITRCAYQPSGVGRASPSRFEALRVPLAGAWRQRGSTIVLCPNSPIYMEHHTGMPATTWVAQVIQRIRQITHRPIVLRWKTDVAVRPLAVDLRDAWIVVVFSSACAVEALAAGVPVCTLAPWASTAPMGITDLAQLDRPIYPPIADRNQFLYALAQHQWTLDEIRRGVAWRALQQEAMRVR